MANIDEGKMQKLAEAAGWIEQARKYYAAWMWEVADSCVVRAQAALNDQCFKRQPIPNFSRDQQPAVLWVKNPLTGAKMLIDGTDYDPKTHEVWEESSPEVKQQGKSQSKSK
jgi:hypothetical protein